MVPSCLAGEAVCVGSTSYGSLTRRFLAERAAATAATAATAVAVPTASASASASAAATAPTAPAPSRTNAPIKSTGERENEKRVSCFWLDNAYFKSFKECLNRKNNNRRNKAYYLARRKATDFPVTNIKLEETRFWY
ncbi:hypothetical protein HZH66_014243 [Vespula vulgaris]|uniref:Uncharacterized protein n=1 Tax=Vespula vulgaris TaxID=7454 RepID=A0A834MPW0_VESVU|nr:hypothetical protein HZH66_014243 [Vespula vulgaris]